MIADDAATSIGCDRVPVTGMYIRVPNGITRGSTATIPLYTPVPVAVTPLPPALAAVYQVAYTFSVRAQPGSASGAGVATRGRDDAATALA